MLDRLCGLETEYAVRAADRALDHRTLFGFLKIQLEGRVRMRPGRGLMDWSRDRVFTENGGSLYYESQPFSPAGGLFEGGTPECRGPAQLLVYQRAQDRLLAAGVAELEDGFGEVGLLKNCRDAFGHVYGTQENYETEMASGPARLVYRSGLALLLPLLPVFALLYWVVIAALVVASIAVLLLVLAVELVVALLSFLPWLRPGAFSGWLGALPQRHPEVWGYLAFALEAGVLAPVLLPYSALLHLTAFRPHRRHALAFFASRCVFSGAGTLDRDEAFHLGERAAAQRRPMRWTFAPSDRGLFETGHLLKGLLAAAHGEPRRVLQLFAARQRLQLGCGDANMCQVAEYLKLGTSVLVLDLLEAGQLDDAPRLADPVAALHAISADPTLSVQVPLRDGRQLTALALQRFYQRRAAEWLAQGETTSLEAHELVKRWGEVLDALERDPGELLGRVDWVSKRYLLETAGAGLSWNERKKIDLRYHELGTGYHAVMEARGLAPPIVTDEEVERAVTEPPADSPATRRGQLVRELADRNERAAVSWDQVKVGSGWRGKVVRLDDWRR